MRCVEYVFVGWLPSAMTTLQGTELLSKARFLTSPATSKSFLEMVADEEFELRLRFGHWEHQTAYHSTSKKSKDPAPKDLPPLPKCDPMYIACPGTRFAGWMPLAGASDLEVKTDAGRPKNTKRIYVPTSSKFISMAAKAQRAADRNRSYSLFAEPPFFTCKHRARMFVRAFFQLWPGSRWI